MLEQFRWPHSQEAKETKRKRPETPSILTLSTSFIFEVSSTSQLLQAEDRPFNTCFFVVIKTPSGSNHSQSCIDVRTYSTHICPHAFEHIYTCSTYTHDNLTSEWNVTLFRIHRGVLLLSPKEAANIPIVNASCCLVTPQAQVPYMLGALAPS